MKRSIFAIICMGFLFTSCKNEEKKEALSANETELTAEVDQEMETTSDLNIEPISHATAVIKWGDAVMYTDPVGGAEVFEGKDAPNFILITDIHGDHMDAKTLEALELGDTKIIVPQAVKDQLPKEMASNLLVMNNGDTKEMMGFSIKAVPMYNLPEAKDAMHTKGRGNGYVIEKDGQRLYISGDTEDIPEMRELKNIDVALVCMNLPYTMTVEDAADGVLAFAPKQVYPYHYRGKDGLSDVSKFKELVNKGNKEIKVVQLNWYPEMK
ncbi:L-ascorbate metabolism protein UlaG (beta-lactamase superfamily) [Gillisia mitskevichiae]|uniref:L-ascorbate metabolism protein UlaG (Beta-lactamase superfamily) n=1 Tax=Gillisia mitskevichiae TaxID=270921 RepID=A0A495PSH1_9FLAO|nr:MBL fold metallo-hydrolase [Gillisia mitskevichiae]RKS53573.1 L-ascorbate metabolism protein UlaG (beta-lactamase superfamily) [Gillisia mitskevichiae]